LSFYSTATRQEVETLLKAKEKRIMDKQAAIAKRTSEEAALAKQAVDEAAAVKRTREEAASMLAPPAPKRFSFGDENTMDSREAFHNGMSLKLLRFHHMCNI